LDGLVALATNNIYVPAKCVSKNVYALLMCLILFYTQNYRWKTIYNKIIKQLVNIKNLYVGLFITGFHHLGFMQQTVSKPVRRVWSSNRFRFLQMEYALNLTLTLTRNFVALSSVDRRPCRWSHTQHLFRYGVVSTSHEIVFWSIPVWSILPQYLSDS